MADPRLNVVEAEPPGAAFYFDLGDPEAWLSAERVLSTLPFAAEWVPVVGSSLPGAESWAVFRCAEERAARLEAIEATARARSLLPVRWPDPFPFDSGPAQLYATYAKSIGRAVAFTQAAFRQAFCGGRVLDQDTLLIAGAACEMHPRAMLTGAATRATAAALEAATTQAIARGVRGVPAVWRDGEVWHGDDQLEAAAEAYDGGAGDAA